jgi:hypothetical protein
MGKYIAWVDVTRTRGFFEDPPTAWETWMFRQWIKREEAIFSHQQELESSSSSPKDRFTSFLYPFRHEGDRPKKAFYFPTPRASSVDRSQKIKDANDMVMETEKAIGLSQSRSSAATSVASGVKYNLDLDWEGALPQRFLRSQGNHAIQRDFQLPDCDRPDSRKRAN